MAEPRDDQNMMSETDEPRDGETSATEHDRVRASNDLDQELEREGVTSRHNRGYDEAVRGGLDTGPTDPDSAESGIDRDDMVDE